MPLVPLGVRELCCALRARQDLVVGNWGAANELYRNEGGGTFTAVTGSPITSGSANTYAVAWGDMDGDGDLVRRRRAPSARLRRMPLVPLGVRELCCALRAPAGSGGGQQA